MVPSCSSTFTYNFVCSILLAYVNRECYKLLNPSIRMLPQFQELETKRMSRLAGDKLVDGDHSIAIRSQWVVTAVEFVWSKRSALISRSRVLPVEAFRTTVFPLVYAAKCVASGAVETLREIARPGDNKPATSAYAGESSAEKLVGVSDIVSHLLPFLSSLDPPLIFEVGINMLSLADVPGGKPEWASAAIIAILTLWDRQEFSSARETIVRAVVANLHLLDLSMQVRCSFFVLIGLSSEAIPNINLKNAEIALKFFKLFPNFA